ncbi:MAG: MarR family transcriptional regulator, partial [Bacteroidota bacterium]
DKLLAKKLVERCTSKEDRRRVDVSITTEGLELLERASHDLEIGLRFEDGNLSQAEAGSLNELLDKLRTLVDESAES